MQDSEEGHPQGGDPLGPDVDADATPNGWLLNPASSLVLFLGNETVIAGLVQRVLMAAQATPTYLSFTQAHLPADRSETQAAIMRLMQFAKTDAAFAAEEIKNEFNTVLSHHAVAIWAAVESTIEQLLINHIRKAPDSKERILASHPAIKGERLKTTTERDARSTIRIWESSLTERSTIERAILMLNAFGVALQLDSNTKRQLTEMAEMRNVILHRRGRADQRLLEKCSWLRVKVGQEVRINPERLGGYIDASHKFAIELMGRLTKSPYIYIRQGDS
jgi:hypothetical protein